MINNFSVLNFHRGYRVFTIMILMVIFALIASGSYGTVFGANANDVSAGTQETSSRRNFGTHNEDEPSKSDSEAEVRTTIGSVDNANDEQQEPNSTKEQNNENVPTSKSNEGTVVEEDSLEGGNSSNANSLTSALVALIRALFEQLFNFFFGGGETPSNQSSEAPTDETTTTKSPTDDTTTNKSPTDDTTTNEISKEDKISSKKVNDAINGLPAIRDLELKHEPQVQEVREMYDALSQEQQELIEDPTRIERSEARFPGLREVEDVHEAIRDIPVIERDLGLEHKERVEKARELVENAKANSNEDYLKHWLMDRLEQAEAKINELENDKVNDAINGSPEHRRKSMKEDIARREDKVSAKEVNDAINGLPAELDIRLNDKRQIQEVRDMYDSLSQEQQELVDDTKRLKRAEAIISAMLPG